MFYFVLRLAFCRKQEDRTVVSTGDGSFLARFENETMKEVDAL